MLSSWPEAVHLTPTAAGRRGSAPRSLELCPSCPESVGPTQRPQPESLESPGPCRRRPGCGPEALAGGQAWPGSLLPTHLALLQM